MLYFKKATLAALESSSGERAIMKFLKTAPSLLIQVFNTGNNTRLVSPEFRFGNRFRADFCILSGHSGGWQIHLIELEPVGARFFNRDGSDSQVLSKAKSQVQDWHTYIKTHQSDFREELANDILKRNIYQKYWNHLNQHLHKDILDTSFSFHCDYYILLGRRGDLVGDDIRRRSYYHDFNRCELVTYDRILDAATLADQATKDSIRWKREWKLKNAAQQGAAVNP